MDNPEIEIWLEALGIDLEALEEGTLEELGLDRAVEALDRFVGLRDLSPGR